MEKYENEKHSRVSWIVFLFSISVVLISLSPVVFPALFSETFFKSEFDNAGILQHVVIEPFEIGGLAIPLIVTNIIVFGIFYFSKSRGLLEKIDFLTKFQVSKKIAIIALIVIIAGYISISINEIEIGKNVGEIDEVYGDWERLKHKLSNMKSFWPEQITSFEPHLKHILLKTSQIVFGNFFVIPLISSIGLLLVTYLFTSKITDSRLAGLISLILVLQSNLFLKFDTSAAFSTFWILFYLLSLYLVIKIWSLSPIFYVLSILSKILTAFYAPMSIFFILSSDISKQRKIIIGLIILIIFLIGIVVSTTQSQIGLEWNSDEFWLGFTAFAFGMRIDSLFILFLLPVTIGLFIKSKSNKYSNSILVLISGALLTAPFLTGLTDQTNQPYRLLPLIVFFSVAVGIIFAKRSSR